MADTAPVAAGNKPRRGPFGAAANFVGRGPSCSCMPWFDYYGYVPHERDPFITWLGFLASVAVTGTLLVYTTYVLFIYFTEPFKVSYSATDYHDPSAVYNLDSNPRLPAVGLEFRLANNTAYYDERYMAIDWSNRYIVGGDQGYAGVANTSRYKLRLGGTHCEFGFDRNGSYVASTSLARCPHAMHNVKLAEWERASLPEIQGVYTDAVYAYLQGDVTFNYTALRDEPGLEEELLRGRVVLFVRYGMVNLNELIFSSPLQARDVTFSRRFEVKRHLQPKLDVILLKREIEKEDSVLGIKAMSRRAMDMVYESVEADYADKPAYNHSLPADDGVNLDASRHFAVYFRGMDYDAQVHVIPEVNLFEVFGNIGGLLALLGLLLGLPVTWYNKWRFNRLLKKAIHEGDLGGAVLDEKGRVRVEDANDVVCTLRRRENSFMVGNGSGKPLRMGSVAALAMLRRLPNKSAGSADGGTGTQPSALEKKMFRSAGGRLNRLVANMDLEGMAVEAVEAELAAAELAAEAGVSPEDGPEQRHGKIVAAAGMRWAQHAGVTPTGSFSATPTAAASALGKGGGSGLFGHASCSGDHMPLPPPRLGQGGAVEGGVGAVVPAGGSGGGGRGGNGLGSPSDVSTSAGGSSSSSQTPPHGSSPFDSSPPRWGLAAAAAVAASGVSRGDLSETAQFPLYGSVSPRHGLPALGQLTPTTDLSCTNSTTALLCNSPVGDSSPHMGVGGGSPFTTSGGGGYGRDLGGTAAMLGLGGGHAEFIGDINGDFGGSAAVLGLSTSALERLATGQQQRCEWEGDVDREHVDPPLHGSGAADVEQGGGWPGGTEGEAGRTRAAQ